jgi:hypothetical protein
MLNLGDVVFCVDCDRNVAAYRSAGGTESGYASNEPQRRMAVKKDANGDRLCVQCLDLRRASRQAEFLLRAERSPLPDQRAAGAQGAEPPARPPILRLASAVRIPRRSIAERTPMAQPVEPVRVQRVSGKAESVRSQPASRRMKDMLVRAKTKHNQISPAVRAVTARVAKQVLADVVAHKREPKAKSRGLERTFLQLTAEIGLLRARILLDQLLEQARELSR